ncbi:hypothetical protein N7501_011865 [Penicillium viridicatum]|nr:hypothetical protein N7501_011865 [Penicillium viridicatum]
MDTSRLLRYNQPARATRNSIPRGLGHRRSRAGSSTFDTEDEFDARTNAMPRTIPMTSPTGCGRQTSSRLEQMIAGRDMMRYYAVNSEPETPLMGSS